MMVLVIAPGKNPIVQEIDGSLKTLLAAIFRRFIPGGKRWRLYVTMKEKSTVYRSIVRFLMNMANCWISSQVRFLSVVRRQTVKVLQIYQKI